MRRPATRFMGSGPKPVESGALWSSTHGRPAAATAAANACWTGSSSSRCHRTMGIGPLAPWMASSSP